MATPSGPKTNKGKNDKAAPIAAKAPAPAAKPVVAAKPTSSAAPKAARYEPTREEIQARAFEIYIAEGCREGNDLENWLRAEKELRTQGSR